MRRGLAFMLLLLASCTIRSEDEGKDMPPSICQPIMFEGTAFTHCIADPQRHSIDTDLAPDLADNPYRSLTALQQELGKDGEDVVMAMNAGMFDPEGQPIGYYVEQGRRLIVLNENEGPGNFHLLPNGVFFGRTASGPWSVLETQSFADLEEERPHFATQSGPMLVIDGRLHPQINPDGTSRKIRNAVGVDDAGRAHFLISEAPVSFGKLGRLYRDVLRVRNALFLDGTVSQLWDPANGRLDSGPELGPFLVVRTIEDVE